MFNLNNFHVLAHLTIHNLKSLNNIKLVVNHTKMQKFLNNLYILIINFNQALYNPYECLILAVYYEQLQ